MSTYNFFVTSLIIILIPGTGVAYTISEGISKGKRASLYATFGCMIGIIPHLCISMMLSSLLLSMSTTVFFIMKLVGSIYLLYLGMGMIFSKTEVKKENVVAEKQPIWIIRRGVLINLLNPKLTLFFFAFLPQYVSTTDGAYIFQSGIYGLVFMLLTGVVFMGYGFLQAF
ncbi:MAG: LysE family translocator [Thermotaleaceae bacterium]